MKADMIRSEPNEVVMEYEGWYKADMIRSEPNEVVMDESCSS